MLKLIIVALLTMLGGSISAQKRPWPTAPIDTTYEGLARRDLDLRIEMNDLRSDTAAQYERLNQHISFASFLMTVFGIMFSIAAIFLGVYVSRVWDRVARARDEQRQSVQDAEKIRIRVEELSNDISTNMQKIYSDIKRREVLHAIGLVEIDGTNIKLSYMTLVTNNLAPDDFERIVAIYHKAKPLLNSPDKGMYLSIIVSNFLRRVIDDRDLFHDILKSIDFIETMCSKTKFIEILKFIMETYGHENGLFNIIGEEALHKLRHNSRRWNLAALLGTAENCLKFISHHRNDNTPLAWAHFHLNFLYQVKEEYKEGVDQQVFDELVKHYETAIIPPYRHPEQA